MDDYNNGKLDSQVYVYTFIPKKLHDEIMMQHKLNILFYTT
jgi:hypothetical protein